jgi:hypothetical protein
MRQDIKADLSLNPPISRLWLLVCLGEAAFLPLRSYTFSMQCLRDHWPTTYEHIAHREDRAVDAGSAHLVAFQRLGRPQDPMAGPLWRAHNSAEHLERLLEQLVQER